jgi:hypothetical protein
MCAEHTRKQLDEALVDIEELASLCILQYNKDPVEKLIQRVANVVISVTDAFYALLGFKQKAH